MEISKFQNFLGWFKEQNSDFLLSIGRLETWTLRKRLQSISIESPIYVCGLARSGTTILLELLSEHPKNGTFRYMDFPLVMLPFWWGRYLQWNSKEYVTPVERSHKDGIYVTPKSPEALEEILWILFFPQSHDPSVSNILDRTHFLPEFDNYYKNTILKVLLARDADRYLAKNNYNVARLNYLKGLFPDARFIIMFRDPFWHIASLIKQHRLISQEETADKRSLAYMRRSGHFEFGLDRRPIHFGSDDVADEIQRLWSENKEVEGWAKYWRCVYSYLADLIENDQNINNNTFIVDYNFFCENPIEILKRIYAFLDLDVNNNFFQKQSMRLRLPSYYSPDFTDDEVETILNQTGDVYSRMKELFENQN